MKKTLVFLLFFCFGNAFTQSFSLDWFSRINSSRYVVGKSIEANSNGDTYSTGLFIGDNDFDPDPNNELILHADDLGKIFIQKLDNEGNLQWVKYLNDENIYVGYALGYDIHVAIENGSEFVYVLGTFGGTVDFDPGSGEYLLTTDTSIYLMTNIFLLKLDSNGNFVWAKNFGDVTSFDISYHFTIDGQGDILLTGFFNIPNSYYSSLYPDPYQELTDLATDMRIIKLNPNGDILWDKVLTGNGNVGANGIAVDSQDNVLIAGNFAGTIDFDPSAGISELISQSEDDIFIEKLDTDGNFIWVKQLAGNIFDGAIDILADDQDNIYTLGYYRQNIDFDPSSNDYIGQSTNNHKNAFVLKLDSSGNFQWVDQFYETDATDIYIFDDKLLVCFIANNYNMDTINGIEQLQHGVNNATIDTIVLELYTDDGSILNQTNISGYNGGIAFPYKMSSYANHVLLIGNFNGEVDFDPSPTGTFMQTAPIPQYIVNGMYDNFTVNLTTGNAGMVNENSLKNIALYPNPTADAVFYIKGITGNNDVSISDVSGKIIKEQKNVTANTPINIPGTKGVYFVRIETENFLTTKKLIVR